MDQRHDARHGPAANHVPRPASWTTFILVNLALLFLAGAGISAALTARFLAAAQYGTAQVISVERITTRGGGTAWITGFALVTPDGRRLTATRDSVHHYALDATIPVLYRAEPTPHIHPIEEDPWVMSLIIAGFGVALLATAGIAYLRHRLRHRHRAGA